MKKLFLIVLIMCCSTAFGQCIGLAGGRIGFSKPFIDTSVLPDASTTALLHFENNLLDLGGGTWSSGWSGFSADNKKFGKYSIYHQTAFNTNAYSFSSTTATSAFTMGTDDFTIEFWAGINVTQNNVGGNNDTILSLSIASGEAFNLLVVGNIYNSVPNNKQYVPYLRLSTHLGIQFSGTYTGHGFFSGLNWFHICFERRSGILYCYINGQQVAAGAMGEISNVTSIWFSAHNRTYLSATFYVDELRAYKGGYVYGGEFSPPSEPFGIKKNNRLNFRGAL